jgi:hypothetical protein
MSAEFRSITLPRIHPFSRNDFGTAVTNGESDGGFDECVEAIRV